MEPKGRHTREPKHAKPKTKLQVLLGLLALALKALLWLTVTGVPTTVFYLQLFTYLMQL